MALLAVLPALVWLFVGCLFPHWLPALPFSTAQVVSGAIGVFLLLTLFFRQWRWTHWAAWLAGNAGAFYLAEHSDDHQRDRQAASGGAGSGLDSAGFKKWRGAFRMRSCL